MKDLLLILFGIGISATLGWVILCYAVNLRHRDDPPEFTEKEMEEVNSIVLDEYEDAFSKN